VLITDFHTHLFNENIDHAFRYEDLLSDVYINKKTGQTSRVKISEEIPDLAVLLTCDELGIDNPVELDNLKKQIIQEIQGGA